MTWLTWRLFRLPTAAVSLLVAVIGVVLVITGPGLSGRTDYSDLDFLYTLTLVAVVVLPGVLGVFLAVPVVTREVEAGTHSLVWNQTITRRQWLANKFGVGLPVAVVAAGALGLAVTWWAWPIDEMIGSTADMVPPRVTPGVFLARGIVPIGYAAFAFALGIAVALVLRHTVAAMAVTLVLFVGVQLAVPFLVRPYVLAPVVETVAITEQNVTEINGTPDGLESVNVIEPDGAWVLANETVDGDGDLAGPLRTILGDCPPAAQRPPSHEVLMSCLASLNDLGYQQRLTYQPEERFWPLQWIETGIFLALAALLAWFSFRRVNHLS